GVRSLARAPRRMAVPLIRPPSWSALFPSTTLFRSRTVPEPGLDLLAGLRLRRRREEHLVSRERSTERAHHRLGLINVNTPTGLRDRKSTRLNSSHVKISYAVFCLKKKNKTAYRPLG